MQRLALLFVLALIESGCARVTLEEFVNQQVGGDPGFIVTAKAADNAQKAYHFIADTPIQDLNGPEATTTAGRFIDLARDSFRKAGTYRINKGEASLSEDGYWITDREAGLHRVRVAGSGVVTLVQVTAHGTSIYGMETDRGLEILSFGGGMVMEVQQTFKPFLVGDSVDVDSIRTIVARVRRGDFGADQPPSSLSPRRTPAKGTTTDSAEPWPPVGSR